MSYDKKCLPIHIRDAFYKLVDKIRYGSRFKDVRGEEGRDYEKVSEYGEKEGLLYHFEERLDDGQSDTDTYESAAEDFHK